MSRKSKGRVATDATETFGSNPFGALDAGGLPQGPLDVAKPESGSIAKKGRVEVRREKAGRGGKTVTTLKAFQSNIPLDEIAGLAFDLKKSLACGGTQKGREIELQGDVVERVMTSLIERGFSPVKSGG